MWALPSRCSSENCSRSIRIVPSVIVETEMHNPQRLIGSDIVSLGLLECDSRPGFDAWRFRHDRTQLLGTSRLPSNLSTMRCRSACSYAPGDGRAAQTMELGMHLCQAASALRFSWQIQPIASILHDIPDSMLIAKSYCG